MPFYASAVLLISSIVLLVFFIPDLLALAELRGGGAAHITSPLVRPPVGSVACRLRCQVKPVTRAFAMLPLLLPGVVLG